MNRPFHSCILSALLACTASLTLPTQVSAQQAAPAVSPYATMMDNALASYITPHHAHPTVLAGINSFLANFRAAQGTFAGTSDPAVWPWPNVTAAYPNAGDALVETLRRTRDLAVTYRQPGTENFASPGVRDRILDVLQWVHQYKYNTTSAATSNWWNSEIGAPRALLECVLLMYPDLSATERAAYLAVVDHWVPNPARRRNSSLVETGANLLDKALIVTMSGVLAGNATRVVQGRDAILPVFDYVTSGDGFYQDGSFIQHHTVPYTGSYGSALLSSYSQMKRTLRGTSFASAYPIEANAIDWIRKSFLPGLYQGASLDNLRGRAIGRQKTSDNAGREIVRDMLRLIEAANPPDAIQLRSEIKWNIRNDRRRANYFDRMEPAAIGEIVALDVDAGVPVTAPAPNTYAWNAMARFFHRQSNYAFSVSAFSKTIGMFESINKENLKGWFTGAGMTTLLNGDGSQYVDGYWPTVDMARLPGITTPGALPSKSPDRVKILNTFPFTGGVGMGGYGGAFGMRFSLDKMPVDNSGAFHDLTGRKSWIAFPKGVVAIGSDLETARANNRSSTIVDNRKISDQGLQLIAVGNASYAPASDWQLTAPAGTRTVLFADRASNSNIGYHFPAGGDIRIARKTTTGSWVSVDGDTQWLLSGVDGAAPLSNDYFQLALEHAGPAAGNYAYVMLPGITSSELLSFGNSPTITVIEGSSDLHAAYDSTNKLLGANVWSKTSNAIPMGGSRSVSVSDPASLFVRETSTAFDVVITDPSANGTGSVVLTFNFGGSGVLPSQVPGMTVVQQSPLVISLARSAMNRTPISFSIRK